MKKSILDLSEEIIKIMRSLGAHEKMQEGQYKNSPQGRARRTRFIEQIEKIKKEKKQ